MHCIMGLHASYPRPDWGQSYDGRVSCRAGRQQHQGLQGAGGKVCVDCSSNSDAMPGVGVRAIPAAPHDFIQIQNKGLSPSYTLNGKSPAS